jgi:hypothetical protein
MTCLMSHAPRSSIQQDVMRRHHSFTCSIAAALFTALHGSTAAQQPGAPPISMIGDTVTVIPGAHYRASGMERLVLGSGWRDVWQTPVDAPVFDFDSYAGGVRILRRGGGFQSRTLHLIEERGWREYRYRSVDKFPQQAMPPAIRGTLSGAVLQDQVSTLFPAAPLLVPPLMTAIGALHVAPDLYVMPDDPRLGEHRAAFAGMLATVEHKPDEAPGDNPGFAGSRKVKGTTQFFNDIDASRVHRLDEREFLAVRLIDFMVNDTDRTADNFEWARFDAPDGTYRWRAVARDRDRAFMDARGLLNSLVIRRFYPKLVSFGPEFSLDGLIHTSFTLDRRLLQRLTRADFEQVALEVQRALTDDVIDAVIAELPTRWRTETSATERLREGLTGRRSALPDVALAFYQDLASEVDVFGTAEDEYASVVRHESGSVTVTITGRDEAEFVDVVRHDNGAITLELNGAAGTGAREPFYRRTFVPQETNEVRLYLGGGDDHAVVRGAATNAIAIRVIGGAGDDVLVDSAGGGATYFYDAEGDNRFITVDRPRVSQQSWTAPEPATGLRLGRAWRPDWGGTSGWSPVFDYAEGSGILIGAGAGRLQYGFRRLPHHWSAGMTVLAGTGSGRVAALFDFDYRAENSPLALTLAAGVSQLDALRFHGYGNDAPRADGAASLVKQQSVTFEPSLVWYIGWRSREGLDDALRGEAPVAPGLRPLVGRIEAGPVLYWTGTATAADAPLLADDVTGAGTFGRVGFRLGLELDRTDREPAPTRGWSFEAALAAFPGVWDATQSFAASDAVAAAYVPLTDGGTHVAVRAGGALASGAFPVQHAAAIGGRSTLRGYGWQRFTGDASAYGSTELRVPTGSVSLFVRWQLGVFGLVDAGRVWHDGRSEGGWHTGVGGGFWLASLGRGVSVAYAHGEAHRVYLSSGLSF